MCYWKKSGTFFIVLDLGLMMEDGYLETLVCYLLGPLAFRIKSKSLPQHLGSDLLACHVASTASLDSVTYLLNLSYIV